MDKRVLIAGGGIGGLATALTLHQIGVPCLVSEAVRDMRPLGVGVNLQPNAVREFYDLCIAREDLCIRSMNGICLRRREPEMMSPRLIGVGSARWIREGGTG